MEAALHGKEGPDFKLGFAFWTALNREELSAWPLLGWRLAKRS